MENFKRMTIRIKDDNTCEVFRMKRARQGGWPTDMAGARFSYSVSAAAKPVFAGSYGDCLIFIESEGYEFMTEHGIAC